MYRRFAFEGAVHATLETVPLAVRRKLDLAGIRITIFGWRALPREDRLSLCHLPVETAEDVAVYREVLMRFTARTGIPVDLIPDRRARAARGACPRCSHGSTRSSARRRRGGSTGAGSLCSATRSGMRSSSSLIQRAIPPGSAPRCWSSASARARRPPCVAAALRRSVADSQSFFSTSPFHALRRSLTPYLESRRDRAGLRLRGWRRGRARRKPGSAALRGQTAPRVCRRDRRPTRSGRP